MKRSISRRLLVSNLLILTAFLGLAGAALDRAFRSSSEAALREQLQAHVYTLLTAAEEGPGGRMRMPDALASPAFNRPDSGLYAEVVGERGAYRWRSGSLLGRATPLAQAIAPGRTRLRRTANLVVFDHGIGWEDDAGNAIPYAIAIAAERALVDAPQAAFRASLWGWLVGLAVLLLAAQLLMLRWGLTPLRHMSDAVRRLESGAATRIDGQVPHELQGLSDNLNALIEQSQQRQARVRNSLADLAHSMKTPLAVLQGLAEQQPDRDLGAQITEQTRRIDDIVSYQRQRAAVAGHTPITRPVALAPVVRRICDSLEKVHRDRALGCHIAVAANLALRADQGDLFELFGNLLENAFRHAANRIEVRATRVDDALRIEIEDDGPGFDDAGAEHLLQRGARADQRHPGEGIGLAVVDEIVRQYRGDVEIRRATAGGALIRLRLPA